MISLQEWGVAGNETSVTHTKANLLKEYSRMKLLECLKLVSLKPKDDM